MHPTERERLIFQALAPNGFVTYRDLEALIEASPSTIRRDLTRLAGEGRLARVRGGARIEEAKRHDRNAQLLGTPFERSITRNLAAKQAIGLAAAALCETGEGIMIDGGTTTLQMCAHLDGKKLQVLTNSLHIVNALLPHKETRILLPSGSLFRHQNIVLAPSGEDSMPRFHAPKLFMGAAAVGPQGVMQADVVLVAAERRLIDRAERLILLVDSSKFQSTSGVIVCDLGEVDTLITDAGITDHAAQLVERAGVTLIVAEP